MKKKSFNDTAIGLAGCSGCLTFLILVAVGAFAETSHSNPWSWIIWITMGTYLLAWYVARLVPSIARGGSDPNNTESITTLTGEGRPIHYQEAEYVGGHKAFASRTIVSLRLYSDRLVVNEMDSDKRAVGRRLFEVPFQSTKDFGISTKEDLSAGAIFLLGLPGVALKKHTKLLYVVFLDQAGIQHCPLFCSTQDSDFRGTERYDIESFLPKLYDTIASARKKND